MTAHGTKPAEFVATEVKALLLPEAVAWLTPDGDCPPPDSWPGGLLREVGAAATSGPMSLPG
jgi:hypothetical protein